MVRLISRSLPLVTLLQRCSTNEGSGMMPWLRVCLSLSTQSARGEKGDRVGAKLEAGSDTKTPLAVWDRPPQRLLSEANGVLGMSWIELKLTLNACWRA